MNILKKTMVAVIAVTSLGTTGSILTATSAQAHNSYYSHTHQKYHAPKCGWEWVKWQDSYNNWHQRRKWVCH